MKEQKGITLIALIITIIVMLILVGVTINVALNGGLFEKAKDASTKTQKEVDKEMLLSAVVATVDNSGNVNLEELKLPEGFTYNSTTKVYKSKTGNEFTINETTGKVEEYVAPSTPSVNPENVIAEETDYEASNGVITGLSPTGLEKLSGGTTKLIIPSSIGGNSITKIGEDAFIGVNKTNGQPTECTNITDIVIPNGMTEIGDYAFAVTNIKGIEIPEGVTKIGQFVFTGCASLTNINLPSTLNTLTYSGDSFAGCTSLVKIQINNTAENIKAITGYPFDDNIQSIIYDKDGNVVD